MSVPTLEDMTIMTIMDQATPEHLLELLSDKKLGDKLDRMLTILASTAEGKARILEAIRKKASACETHFSSYESMKMDRQTGPCTDMRDPKTRIEFTWCPHWGHNVIRVNKGEDLEFKQKGLSLGFESSVYGFFVKATPVDKQHLLDLCKSEGMHPEALTCLDLLLERQWFYQHDASSSKRKRHE